MRLSNTVRAATLCLLGLSFAGPSAAQQWTPLRERVEIANIDGQQVSIPLRPEIATEAAGDGKIKVALRVTALLAELQAKTPDLLRTLAAAKSDCRNRWSFPDIQPPAAADGRLRVAGRVELEPWICEDWIKTKLVPIAGDFTIGLFPAWTATELSLNGELERFDLGIDLANQLGLAEQIRTALNGSLQQLFNKPDNSFGFPEEFAALQPKFTSASIVAIPDGGAALVVEAEGLVAAENLAALLAQLN